MVDRDTQEWQRPWREDQQRAGGEDQQRSFAPPSGGPASFDAEATGEVDGRSERSSTDADARVETVPLGTAANGARAATGARVEPVRTPDAVRTGPEPPPGGWSASDDGPGSPTGSVRPPDTSGTVDAPPGAGRRGRLVVPLVAALLGSVVGTAATIAVVSDRQAATSTTGTPAESSPVRAPLATVTPEGDAASEQGNIVPVVARAVLPSVVNIDVFQSGGGGPQQQLGLGSGVIYRSDGYVLTNNHVVESADEIQVRFSDGSIDRAELVGTDRLTDIAVLKVDADGLPAVNLREQPLDVGETAVAIGSPFGLEASVTAGIISGLNRSLQVPATQDDDAFTIPAVVQTDAAINPGNSGGALVDAEGRLIGINTAILTRSGGSQGVGFAIPVEAATASADQLIADGFVPQPPLLGIRGRDVPLQVAERYREEFGIDLQGGAVVEDIEPGTGADQGGMLADDVIVRVDDQAISSMSDVVAVIRSYTPGDQVDIEVLRGGERVELDVTLGERGP